MGDVIDFYGKRRIRTLAQRWRAGDMAMCGANEVQIVAVDGMSALVRREAPFGPWSSWTRLSNLQRIGSNWPRAAPNARRTKEPPWSNASAASADARRSSRQDRAKQTEQDRREMEWENEGGRVRRDEKLPLPASEPRYQE